VLGVFSSMESPNVPGDMEFELLVGSIGEMEWNGSKEETCVGSVAKVVSNIASACAP